jgi:hypothetical protein
MKPPENMPQEVANAVVNGLLWKMPVDYTVSPDELGTDEREGGGEAYGLSSGAVARPPGDVPLARWTRSLPR